MRYIQFAQQFAGQDAEVISVVDMRQELLIHAVERIPWSAVHTRIIEFLLGLLPDMLVEASLLFLRAI